MAVTLSGEQRPQSSSLEFVSHCLDSRPALANSQTAIDRVQQLVVNEKYEDALEATHNANDDSLRNLRAVVLMRIGRTEEAVSILRSITISSGSLEFKPNIPTPFKTNFVTALFMTGRVAGCLELLQSVGEQSTTGITSLLDTISAWERSLTWWQWIDWKLCRIVHHTGNISINYVPGEF